MANIVCAFIKTILAIERTSMAKQATRSTVANTIDYLQVFKQYYVKKIVF